MRKITRLEAAERELSYAQGAVDAIETVWQALPASPGVGQALAAVREVRGEHALRLLDLQRKVARLANSRIKRG